MAYGRTKRVNCCYQCQKRTIGCHATCPEFAEETEARRAENKAKKSFLNPAGSRYFKKPEKLAASAIQSKKRYR